MNNTQHGKGGMGMGKHRTSGVAHNHALSLRKQIETNRSLEEERKKREGDCLTIRKITDLLPGYNK